MRNEFGRQLQELDLEITEMGALCEHAIAYSSKAILETDEALRALKKKADNHDDKINKKERDIETLCLRVILQQQPVATDFRRVSAALKMITDMERIGDEANSVVDLFSEVKYNGEGREQFSKMAQLTVTMLDDVVDAYVKRDLNLAREVMKKDDEIDAVYSQVKEWLVDMIASDKERGREIIDLFMVAKYFERIGDHIVNIGEWVEFSITGVHKGESIS